MNNMYEQLARYDRAARRSSRSWPTPTTSSDGATWTFKLHPASVPRRQRRRRARRQGGDRAHHQARRGAAYEWDAVKAITAPDATTLVFKLKYAAPLDLIASSAYGPTSTTRRPRRRAPLPWFGRGHEAGTGPYELSQWNKGADVEVRPQAVLRLLEGLGRHPLRQRRLPPRAAGHHRAQLLRSGDATFARQLNAQLFNNVKSARAWRRR